MSGKKITGLAASFDLESTGLKPDYGRLLCGVVKPWGQEPIAFRLDHAKSDDSALVSELVEELSQYAILFAHNGVYHDRAFLNGRALQYNLPILDNSAKMVDPCLIARRHLNMGRNTLDALAQHFNLNEQKMHLSPEVWVRASLDHDEAAMEKIVERCISDTLVLEELAQRVLALVSNITPWGSA